MASYVEEQKIRAHLELIAEAGTYAGYFEQGTNADGDESFTLILTVMLDKKPTQTHNTAMHPQ